MCDILTKILEQGHSIYIITIVHIGIVLDNYCLLNNIIMIDTFLYIGYIKCFFFFFFFIKILNARIS